MLGLHPLKHRSCSTAPPSQDQSTAHLLKNLSFVAYSLFVSSSFQLVGIFMMYVLLALFSAAITIGRVIVWPTFSRTCILSRVSLPLVSCRIFGSLLCGMFYYVNFGL